MIRLSPRARPEAWTTVDINLDGEPAPLRVKFWLLAPVEAAAWTAERLKGYSAIRGTDEALGLDFLLRELSAEQIGRISALLQERIVDWDLIDADSPEEPPATLAVTPEAIAAVLAHGAFLRPLFQGLLDASSGAARKNA